MWNCNQNRRVCVLVKGSRKVWPGGNHFEKHARCQVESENVNTWIVYCGIWKIFSRTCGTDVTRGPEPSISVFEKSLGHRAYTQCHVLSIADRLSPVSPDFSVFSEYGHGSSCAQIVVSTSGLLLHPLPGRGQLSEPVGLCPKPKLAVASQHLDKTTKPPSGAVRGASRDFAGRWLSGWMSESLSSPNHVHPIHAVPVARRGRPVLRRRSACNPKTRLVRPPLSRN